MGEKVPLLTLLVRDDPGGILVFWLVMATIGWAIGMLAGAYV